MENHMEEKLRWKATIWRNWDLQSGKRKKNLSSKVPLKVQALLTPTLSWLKKLHLKCLCSWCHKKITIFSLQTRCNKQINGSLIQLSIYVQRASMLCIGNQIVFCFFQISENKFALTKLWSLTLQFFQHYWDIIDK